ncbi:MAG: tetratricopeptide repeat protein [Saprospiraceae bacterium]|nr:tetratricopeptide repeat protein [Saprospiraceae bacterium]MDW8230953.1 tetratricopeptide repeat protein [Saprospiraceae bacterium]
MSIQQGPFRLIFKGRLDFGNERTFEKVQLHWQGRMENYFKTNLVFKMEDVLKPETFSLLVPQQKLMGSEKSWRMTVELFRELAQYATAGYVAAWCLSDEGTVDQAFIEPSTDKVAVQEYLRGKQLVGIPGQEMEAAQALSRAIEKYERHALAYERRGYVNYKLGNYDDALHDFERSISLHPHHPDAYYGRGKLRMRKNDWAGAAEDFGLTVQNSLALQPIHWLARLRKAECLVNLKKYAEACKDLQLFLKRNFSESDPNFYRLPRASYLLGKALLGLNDPSSAIEAFDRALSMPAGEDQRSRVESLLHRAIAKHQIGRPEYTLDLRAAAQMGSDEAARLLDTWQR